MTRVASFVLLSSLGFLWVFKGMSVWASPAHTRPYDMVVAQDGSGDHVTIQSAIDAAKAFPPERIVIFIREGIYREKVTVHPWNPYLSLIGENMDRTVITYADSFNSIDRDRNSTFFTFTLQVLADDFIARNLTIRNEAGPVGQAVALHVDADRIVFENCHLAGHQDTLYVAGSGKRQYFRNCTIEGSTDFIFGAATAVFQDCRLHSLENSYITAASTPEGVPFGLVFLDCRLTADPGVNEVYLGRPWRDHAKTVFVRTEMDGHIHEDGWHDWSRPESRKTVHYAEYGSFGAGARVEGRVPWAINRSAEDAASYYTLENIFAPRAPSDASVWYPTNSQP